ncbi:MAG: flagellin FliC [Nevskiaceae bacterium]|nr:MAG: flagellin FliC [Nevskiaceae bacterium]TBR71565.1 MAG: flagellin FliC [Nevskiaceae bacterium]
MALVLNTNIMSLNSQNALNRTQNTMQTSMQRLSTGLRVNSAADDAAGYAVSTRMSTQLNGMDQGIRNTNDAISLLQTASGGLNQIISNLQQLSSLAVEAGNPTMSSSDRTNLDAVSKQLLAENSRIAQTTNFNGVALFGTGSALASGALAASSIFRIGTQSGDTISISALSTLVSALKGAFSSSISMATASGISATITALNTALSGLTTNAAKVGAIQNRFQAVVENLQTNKTNLTAARSQIVDVDYAAETANLTKSQIMQQAGVAMVAQANQIPQSILKLLP